MSAKIPPKKKTLNNVFLFRTITKTIGIASALIYSQELWRGVLNWSGFKLVLLLFLFIFCPPVWIIFTLPLGHKYSKVPIIKFMSYLTSHIYLMFLLAISGITPLYTVVRPGLFPYWYELALLVMLSGLLLFELTNPSDKSGLGFIKLLVLLFGMLGVGVHVGNYHSIPFFKTSVTAMFGMDGFLQKPVHKFTDCI